LIVVELMNSLPGVISGLLCFFVHFAAKEKVENFHFKYFLPSKTWSRGRYLVHLSLCVLCYVMSEFNQSYFFFSAQHTVTRGIMFLSCVSIHASRIIVNTISWKVYERFPPINDASWDRDERVIF